MNQFAKLKTGLLCLGFLSLAQCGGEAESNSDKVSVSVAPKQPIVITSEYKFLDPSDNTKTITISPNWTRASVTIINSHPTHRAIILTIEINISGFDTNGLPVTSKSSVTPGTLVPPSTSTILAALDPVGGATTSATIPVFIQSMPTSVVSLIYRAEVVAIGWFSDPSDTEMIPLANLKQKVQFITSSSN